AAVAAAVAPAVHGIAAAHGGDVSGLAVDHRQTIQVAAVLRRQLADEVRFPDRLEAVRLAQLGEAGILGVDEHHLAVAADSEFVDVEVADGLRVPRHVALVEAPVDHLVWPQHVLEAPQLVQAAQVDALGVADDAHGALEDPLEEGDAALAIGT